MMETGFDGLLYIKKQTEKITERIEKFGNKLYLEVGGKLFDDFHAAHVLPGYDVNGKVKVLKAFQDKAEMLLCIKAGDIEANKVRSDLGISYDMDVLRHMDKLRQLGLYISSVVITQYAGQAAADAFRNKLEMRGEKVYMHKPTLGYPTRIDLIVSDEGYGANPYIETTRPLVIVAAPGPGSGKMATCLSQLYHEYRRGIRAGYAKFETFPTWNLPLKHPVNLAYEAATADLKDVNMIDPFHLDAYGEKAVNYNRDIEVFPIVRTILENIMGKNADIYRSPTDMGVNMTGMCISSDENVCEAAKQEIIRRYYKALCAVKQGQDAPETAERIKLLMNELDIHCKDRAVVAPCLAKAASIDINSGTDGQAVCIELKDGTRVTGKSSAIITAASAAMLNAVKYLAGIADGLHLLSPDVLKPMISMKRDILRSTFPVLNTEEVLSAMSICAVTNTAVELAISKLPELHGCEAHASSILSASDDSAYRKLGMLTTCEPEFPTKKLYFK